MIGPNDVLRFWAIHQGQQVKLTLAPGEAIDVESRAVTEEGYEARWTQYERVGNRLFVDVLDQGQDCDGVHDTSSYGYLEVSDLRAAYAPDGIGDGVLRFTFCHLEERFTYERVVAERDAHVQ